MFRKPNAKADKLAFLDDDGSLRFRLKIRLHYKVIRISALTEEGSILQNSLAPNFWYIISTILKSLF
jgi:hypothetical protein